MGRLPNLGVINYERSKAIRIQDRVGDAIVVEKEEITEFLKNIIIEEIDLFSTSSVKARTAELENRVSFKLKTLEHSLVELINDRVDKITEKIVELTLSRIIEAEVDKRVSERIEKIKKIL